MPFWNNPSEMTPKQSHRWIISFGDRNDDVTTESADRQKNKISQYFAKSVDRPSYEIGVQTAKYLYSHSFNFPKRLSWKPITIVFHDVIIEKYDASFLFIPTVDNIGVLDTFKPAQFDYRPIDRRQGRTPATPGQQESINNIITISPQAPQDYRLVGEFTDKVRQSTQVFFYKFLQNSGYFDPNENEPENKNLRFKKFNFKKNMISSLVGKEDGTLDIIEISPTGETVETWKLYNPLVSDVKFDRLDYSNDNIVTITATVAYDWAKLVPVSKKLRKAIRGAPLADFDVNLTPEQLIQQQAKEREELPKSQIPTYGADPQDKPKSEFIPEAGQITSPNDPSGNIEVRQIGQAITSNNSVDKPSDPRVEASLKTLSDSLKYGYEQDGKKVEVSREALLDLLTNINDSNYDSDEARVIRDAAAFRGLYDARYPALEAKGDLDIRADEEWAKSPPKDVLPSGPSVPFSESDFPSLLNPVTGKPYVEEATTETTDKALERMFKELQQANKEPIETLRVTPEQQTSLRPAVSPTEPLGTERVSLYEQLQKQLESATSKQEVLNILQNEFDAVALEDEVGEDAATALLQRGIGEIYETLPESPKNTGVAAYETLVKNEIQDDNFAGSGGDVQTPTVESAKQYLIKEEYKYIQEEYYQIQSVTANERRILDQLLESFSSNVSQFGEQARYTKQSLKDFEKALAKFESN